MGSCLGKGTGSDSGAGVRSLGMQVDLAMTDPDLGWRRRNRHIVNAHTYPSGAWRIEGLRPRYGEAVLTGMIELSIAAGVRALEIFSRYESLADMDDGVDLNLIKHADNDIHKHFGLMKLEWKLLERCRPFRCAEVNPNGIQGAATLAKIKRVDNRMSHQHERERILKAEGLPITQGSSWKEGDRVQIMVHNIGKSGSEEEPVVNETRYFFIDSAEVALNIIEFERQITRTSSTYEDFVGQAIDGWVINQSVVMKDPRAANLMRERLKSGIFMKYVYVISPKGELFEFVPEELLLSVTSRLQEAFMTQSAF